MPDTTTSLRIQEPHRTADVSRWARSVFLAEAGALVERSLSYEDTLASVAQLGVPSLADWCTLDLSTSRGDLERVAVAHVEPAEEDLLWRLGRDFPPSPADAEGPGAVLQSGRARLYPRVNEALKRAAARSEEHLALLQRLNAASIMIVPLRARGRTMGVMTLGAAERRYDEDGLGLAEELAGRCALAVDNARLYEEARDAEHRLEESLALLDTIFAKAPVGLAFFDLAGRYRRVNDVLAATNGLDPEAHLGRRVEQVVPGLEEAMGEALRWVAEEDEPLMDLEVTGETPAAPGEERSWLMSFYPVHGKGGERLGIGTVVTEITERKRAEAERQRLLSRLDELARTDALTGLSNRRVWDEELPRELARSARDGRPVCVALLDLDEFKRYNDERGHLEGDRHLAEVASAWRSELRDVDLLVRYGGEEFAAVLPNTTKVEAREAIDRVRSATPGAETASAGIAAWNGDEPPESLVARADRALYAAKEAGRNRTVIAP